MREIEEKDLVGKTITHVDTRAKNATKLTFSDGTELELWAACVISTPYGNIYGVCVEG